MTQSFAQKVASRNHTITVEISPPKGTDVSLFFSHIKPITQWVDAINVPDCQRSILKMSSLAACKLIQDELGVEAVWQMTGRDRNVIALQADMIGAWAMGIHTILALTGDPVAIGDQADVAKQVSHVDALRMLDLIKALNADLDATGKELKRKGTRFCTGAALNPHKMSRNAQIHRLKYKLGAGVDFFQTQPVYDVDTVQDIAGVISGLCDTLHREPPKVMIGIIPPKSAEFARFMNQKILGISIPESFIDILERSKDPVQESIRYCADLVQEMIPHAGGFHFMPVGMEKHSAALLEACFSDASGLRRLKAL